MSELLDVFDDEGLLDVETRSFLVEALANSSEDDWHDILEPFLRPDAAIEVLTSVPGVIERSLKALAAGQIGCGSGTVAPSALSMAFHDTLPKVLQAVGLHTIAACTRLSRAASVITSETEVWLSRAQNACSYWSLPIPVTDDGTWKEKFFKVLRPRFDGVYVGECGSKRWVPVGLSTDMRKNAASLTAFGGRGGHYEWVGYRRYVRLIPPDWALVLQDACPRAAALKVMHDGVDMNTHKNPGKHESALSDAIPNVSDPVLLRKRIYVGHFTFKPAMSSVEIRFTAGDDGEFQSVFTLSHDGPRGFADSLEWSSYDKTDSNGSVLTFNLGRLPDWKGGGLIDEGKDHFPSMKLRAYSSLEHLLQ